MPRKMYLAAALGLALLAAGCGEVPTMAGGQPPPATMPAYPPPPVWTEEPTEIPLPPMTPWPTVPATPQPTYLGPEKPTRPVKPVLPFPTPAFPPTPVGTAPAEMGEIWYPYWPAPDARPVLRAVLVDKEGRRWGDAGKSVDLGLDAGIAGPWLRKLYMSPDGHSLAADVQYGDAWYGSYWITSASGQFGLITAESERLGFLAWGPGRQVLVGKPEYREDTRLLNLDTGEYQVLLFPKWDYGYGARAFATSSDGWWIADASIYGPTVSHPGSDIEIGLTPLTGGQRALIASFQIPGGADILPHNLAWSPDGQWFALLLLTRSLDDPRTTDGELWLVHKDGGEAAALVRGLTVYCPPAWSPDSRYVAFARAKHPSRSDVSADLWMLDTATLSAIQLASFPDRRITSFAWSPDGQRLALAVTMGEYGEVWATSLDGTERYPVAGPTAPWTPVAWLPRLKGGQ